jgi:hypothetical protein
MRLINTTTLRFEEFEPAFAPAYAILSHTWNDKEWTHQRVLNVLERDQDVDYMKLVEGCRVASRDGYGYFWIDTCCIDKTNNAELSEAINSMFSWYQGASKCFVYLADVSSDLADKDDGFAQSRWFKRGWTLQELLAPSEVIFLAKDWTEIGSKAELASTISNITHIPIMYLLGKHLEHASVAQRLSWVATRQTTKAEDIAYCLLGLFDIHMPLLYGERETGAFVRLQEEIIKKSNDQSIFAWSSDGVTAGSSSASSLLAQSPAAFRNSGNIIKAQPPQVEGYLFGIRTPATFGNTGLRLALPLISSVDLESFPSLSTRRRRRASEPSLRREPQDEVLAILACMHQNQEDARVAVWLEDVSTNGGRYLRTRPQTLESIPMTTILSNAAFESLLIPQGSTDPSPQLVLTNFEQEDLAQHIPDIQPWEKRRQESRHAARERIMPPPPRPAPSRRRSISRRLPRRDSRREDHARVASVHHSDVARGTRQEDDQESEPETGQSFEAPMRPRHRLLTDHLAMLLKPSSSVQGLLVRSHYSALGINLAKPPSCSLLFGEAFPDAAAADQAALATEAIVDVD